jgi:hypothetical protein
LSTIPPRTRQTHPFWSLVICIHINGTADCDASDMRSILHGEKDE